MAHQLSVIAQTANRVAIMYLGRIIELGPAAAVFRGPQHPYTLALLAAHPQPDPSHRMNIEFRQGSVVAGVTKGCQYRERCPYAESVCEEDPPLAPARPGRLVARIPRPLGSASTRSTVNEPERPRLGGGCVPGPKWRLIAHRVGKAADAMGDAWPARHGQAASRVREERPVGLRATYPLVARSSVDCPGRFTTRTASANARQTNGVSTGGDWRHAVADRAVAATLETALPGPPRHLLAD